MTKVEVSIKALHMERAHGSKAPKREDADRPMLKELPRPSNMFSPMYFSIRIQSHRVDKPPRIRQVIGLFRLPRPLTRLKIGLGRTPTTGHDAVAPSTPLPASITSCGKRWEKTGSSRPISGTTNVLHSCVPEGPFSRKTIEGGFSSSIRRAPRSLVADFLSDHSIADMEVVQQSHFHLVPMGNGQFSKPSPKIGNVAHMSSNTRSVLRAQSVERSSLPQS